MSTGTGQPMKCPVDVLEADLTRDQGCHVDESL